MTSCIFSILALIFAATMLTAAEDSNGELINRAKKSASNGQQDEAMALAAKAIESEPKNPRGYFVRARLYEQGGDSAKALSDYDQVLKLDSSMAEAWQQRGT